MYRTGEAIARGMQALEMSDVPEAREKRAR